MLTAEGRPQAESNTEGWAGAYLRREAAWHDHRRQATSGYGHHDDEPGGV